MNEHDDNKILVYFVPGDLVLLIRHSADIAEHDPAKLEENVANYLLDLPEIRGGSYDDRLIETLRDPNRRRLTNLRTREQSLTTLTLETGLLYDDLILLVEELNNRLRERTPQGRLGVIRASFNWLSNLSQGTTHTVGGPGAKPVAVDQTTAEHDLGEEVDALLKLLKELPEEYLTTKNPVVNIAILDTAPPFPMMAAQLHRLVLSSATPHPLAELLGTSPKFDAQLNADGDFLVVTGNKLPNPNLSFRISYNLMRQYRSRLLMDVLNSGAGSVDMLDHAYKMTDHGLFVASTISSFLSRIIAEFNPRLRVKIHLIQVLNDYGVGTVDCLVRGLNWAVNNPDVKRGEPLIVNCSLTITAPREGHSMDFDRMENPKAGRLNAHSRDYLTRFFVDKPSLADDMFAPVAEMVVQLQNEDISIAAAAGNESRGLPQKKNARFPAAFKEIIGVGALGKNDKPTDYSNKRDLPITDGADALGGEVEDVGGEVVSTKGVPGWYIGDIPVSARNPLPTPSPSGWARWAGTSFATPRITVLLALLRAHGMTKRQLQTLRKP